MTPSGADRLKASVGRLRRRDQPAFEPDPSSAFEVAIAERVKFMQKDLDQIRTRLNWVLGLIVAAAAANVLLSLFR